MNVRMKKFIEYWLEIIIMIFWFAMFVLTVFGLPMYLVFELKIVSYTVGIIISVFFVTFWVAFINYKLLG